MHHSRPFALLVALLWLAGCTTGERDHPVFKLLTPEQTGITFANTITTNDTFNIQTDVYVYNGAGVAVGDIDNDGLPDIFFSGNMVSSRLYRNKGHFKFEDITERAGVRTSRWATGATMVDINNDGYLDIYVSVSGPQWSKAEERANLLFVNNKDGTFTEEGAVRNRRHGVYHPRRFSGLQWRRMPRPFPTRKFTDRFLARGRINASVGHARRNTRQP